MGKNNSWNWGHIVVFLWLLYWAQGPILGEGGMLATILASGLLLLSIVHFIRVNISGNLPRTIKALDALVILFTIQGVYNLIRGDITGYFPSYFYLKTYWISLLPVYSFYYYSKKGKYSEKFLRISFVFILVAFIGMFFYNQKIALQRLNVEETTNNIGYEFVSLIPFLYLFRDKRKIQMVWAVVLMFFILTCFKRGAILVGAVSLAVFMYSGFLHSSRRGKFGAVVLALIVIGFGAYYVGHLLETSTYFLNRVEDTLEGNSSNRDIIYGGIWDFYLHKASFVQQIFGGGADFSFKIVGTYAHCDWLQFLVDTGLIGVILYFAFYVSLYKDTRSLRKQVPLQGHIIILVLIELIIISVFSMSIIELMMPYQLMLGYCLAGLHSSFRSRFN